MSEPCIDIFFLMGYNTSLYVIFLFSDDHTLVQLRPLPGSRRPEYINASFIDGFQKSRAYIATQVKHRGLHSRGFRKEEKMGILENKIERFMEFTSLC